MASVEPVTAAAPPAAPEGEEAADPSSLLEQALRRANPQTVCDEFDYGAQGGLRNAWCHRPLGMSATTLQQMAGVKIFAGGPHVADSLSLQEAGSFGHYNPEFVSWLGRTAVSPRGSVAQLLTQPAYDQYAKRLARIFWLTQAKLNADPACAARELKAYEKAIKAKKAGYYERFFYFMNPAFCGKTARSGSWYMDRGFDMKVDGNVTKSATAFWLRRRLDGTHDGFAEALRNLLSSYDPAVLEEDVQPYADPKNPVLTPPRRSKNRVLMPPPPGRPENPSGWPAGSFNIP